MKKKFLLYIFFILLLSNIITATNLIWDKQGYGETGQYIQNLGSTYANYDFTVSTINNISTPYSPILADLDNDGLNELVVITLGNEIRLYRGYNFASVDTYANNNLTLSGQYVVENFIDSTDNKEIVLITSPINSTKELWVINWNGSNFNITKKIDLETYNDSNGLNCDNIDSDSDIECLYYSSDGKLYAYDSTNNFATSPIWNSGDITSDCTDISIPKFFDYDKDGDKDILINYGCVNVAQLKNNGAGIFTKTQEYASATSPNLEVNNFAIADLDGGFLEVVILQSNYYASVGVPPSENSRISIYNSNTGSLVCSDKIDYLTKKYSNAYLTGLRNCYTDGIDDNCDINGDGWNDIWLLAKYPNDNENTTILVYDIGCNGGEIANYKINKGHYLSTLYYPIMSGDNDATTSNFPYANWGDYDNDGEFELLFFGGIFEYNGTQLTRGIANESTTVLHKSNTYFITGEISNNGLLDIIIQNEYYNPAIKVYSFSFQNHLPEFTNIEVDTGNPICVNETVTYSVSYSDSDNQYVRAGYDCYGSGDYLYTSYQYSPISFDCLYNYTGNINTIISLQDSYMNTTDNRVNTSYTATVSNSEYCNNKGEGGGSILITETGTSGGVSDWSGQIPNWLNDWGFKSTASKIFFGICIIVALIMLSSSHYKNAFVSIVIGILGVIGLTYLGIFPIWLVFLIFTFTVMLVFLVIFKFSNSGED